MALPRAEIFDFPINGICKLKNYNYSKFENRLDKLLKMTIDEYLDQLDKPTSYIMEFNKETNAVQKSVEKIDLILKSNSC